MRVFIERENRFLEIHFEGVLKDLLKKIRINKETVLVMRNDELLTDEEKVRNSDELKIISVVSGG